MFVEFEKIHSHLHPPAAIFNTAGEWILKDSFS